MNTGISSPEIQEQFDQLFSSILIEQRKINAVRPSDPKLKTISDELLKEFGDLKGKPFFFSYYSTGKGHGPFTELTDGSIKYDLIGGIGPNLLGHSHPLYIKANLEAALNDVMTCGNLLAYPQAHHVARDIVKSVEDSRLKHFWFCGSGSFANDTALKIIWQKKSPSSRLLAFKKAFAGRSIATQDITHNEAYRIGMPKSVSVDHVPHFNQKNPEESLKETMSVLNELWDKHGEDYCAISLELIQGEGGFVFGTHEYYKTIFEWAKEKGLYIWIDEVQSFARTTELFAFQTFGLQKYVDIVTVGKALQVCGVLYTNELNPKPGLIAGTFNGTLGALLASQKTLNYLTKGNIYGDKGRVKELETKFTSRLKELYNEKLISYYGGIGTMISFEVGDSSKEITMKFIRELFENGLICFSAGKDPYRIRFLLPLTLTDDHIDEIFSIIRKTLNKVLK